MTFSNANLFWNWSEINCHLFCSTFFGLFKSLTEIKIEECFNEIGEVRWSLPYLDAFLSNYNHDLKWFEIFLGIFFGVIQKVQVFDGFECFTFSYTYSMEKVFWQVPSEFNYYILPIFGGNSSTLKICKKRRFIKMRTTALV